jgi:hypothetical protein
VPNLVVPNKKEGATNCCIIPLSTEVSFPLPHKKERGKLELYFTSSNLTPTPYHHPTFAPPTPFVKRANKSKIHSLEEIKLVSQSYVYE